MFDKLNYWWKWNWIDNNWSNLIYKLFLVRGYGPLGQLIKSIEMTMVSDININIVMIGWRLSGNNEEIPEEENGHGKLCPNVIKHY